MISPLVNSIVVAGFGFFIGIVLQIAMNVMPERTREPYSFNFKKGWRGFLESANKSAEEGREIARTIDPGFRIAMIAFYGLIAVLILILVNSPLVMNWLVFILSFFAGFLLFDWMYNRAKEGKLSSPSSSSNGSSQGTSESGQ